MSRLEPGSSQGGTDRDTLLFELRMCSTRLHSTILFISRGMVTNVYYISSELSTCGFFSCILIFYNFILIFWQLMISCVLCWWSRTTIEKEKRQQPRCVRCFWALRRAAAPSHQRATQYRVWWWRRRPQIVNVIWLWAQSSITLQNPTDPQSASLYLSISFPWLQPAGCQYIRSLPTRCSSIPDVHGFPDWCLTQRLTFYIAAT